MTALLAHDQVWNRDDWLTIAIVPPLLWILAVSFVYVFSGFDKDALKFSAWFVGAACLSAWGIVWALAGICSVGGCL